jgi:hypothetical protein
MVWLINRVRVRLRVKVIVINRLCKGDIEEGIVFDVDCDVKDEPYSNPNPLVLTLILTLTLTSTGKKAQRNVLVKFSSPVTDEIALKRIIIHMAVTGKFSDCETKSHHIYLCLF